MVEIKETSRQVTHRFSEEAQWWLVSTMNDMLRKMGEPARFEIDGDGTELTLKIEEAQ